MKNKQQILAEIQRTAKENGGKALGKRQFEAATGISESDWIGRHWARWGDAVRDAGYAPNELQQKTSDAESLAKLAAAVRELGRLPTVAEMRMRKLYDPAFPNHKVFERFGSRSERLARLEAFCVARSEWADVAAICSSLKQPLSDAPEVEPEGQLGVGYVYLALMRVGSERRYKIGKADIVGQRTRQIAVTLPDKLTLIHAISTDDAYGIENYWHQRFAAKRLNGEWFKLDSADVKAFRRRKFM